MKTTPFYEYEYLLLLQLPKEVEQQIIRFKDIFRKTYHYPNALVTYPHLTLLKFKQFGGYEKAILYKIEQLAAYAKPFHIILKGFNSFQQAFYVNVSTKQAVLDVIYKHRLSLSHLLNSTYFSTHPHVTIARGLSKKQSEEVKQSWKTYSYEADFIAEKMLLVKRASPITAYKLVQIIHLTGTKYYPKQLFLF